MSNEEREIWSGEPGTGNEEQGTGIEERVTRKENKD